MRILITSDLQWSDQDRDDYRHQFVERFLKIARKVLPNRIYILGDLTEEKDSHSARLVNRVVDHLYRMSQVAPLLVLRGNHDYRDIGHPFFEFVSRFERMTWVNTPMMYDDKLFLPHTRDWKRDWDWDGSDIKNHRGLVFAHNIFEGVKAHGRALAGIPTAVFHKDAKVFSGDVHEPQTIGQVTYVGSPYLCDAGDDYDPRVLLLEGQRATSIEVGGPQKRLIDIEIVNGEIKRHNDFNDGDIAKILVHLLPDQTAQWQALKEKVERWASKHRLQYVTIAPVFHKKVQRGERPAYVRKTDEEYLTNYGKRVDADDMTMKIGRKLLEA